MEVELKIWIARDKDGTLKLFFRTPFRSDPFDGIPNGCWICDGNRDWMEIDKNLVPNFQWEDGAAEVDVKVLEKVLGIEQSQIRLHPIG